MTGIRTGMVTAALAALTLALSGCSVSFSAGKAVDSDEVAQTITTKLTEQVGKRPDSVTCPEDLPAEKGSSIRCELTEDGKSLGITVTVTSVGDGKVLFDVKVDEQPSG